MKTKIYLDYNASAPLRPQARDAMMKVLNIQNAALNASSVHSFGREGRKIIEDSREKIAKLVGADTNQVIFNSGATEGNNTVIRHFEDHYPSEIICISAVEHPSVHQASKKLRHIPVNQNGIILPEELDKFLSNNPKTCLVSIMFSNNETGVTQNVADLSNIAHRYGALFHCDGVQAAGRIPIDIKELGIDFLTLSSHKIGGGQGVGALILGACGQTPTLLHGGGQEKYARAGTENIAGIAGFAAAAQSALLDFEENIRIEKLRDTLECELKDISPTIVIHGENVPRLPNTSFFSLPNANAQSLMIALDLEGIALSNGSACSSGTVKPSQVLKTMGVSNALTASALRISLGWATKETDVEAFLSAWKKIIIRQIR